MPGRRARRWVSEWGWGEVGMLWLLGRGRGQPQPQEEFLRHGQEDCIEHCLKQTWRVPALLRPSWAGGGGGRQWIGLVVIMLTKEKSKAGEAAGKEYSWQRECQAVG